MQDHSRPRRRPVLTALAAVVPPRIAHAIARPLRLTAVIEMFCQGPCCPEWTAWAPTTEEAA